MDTTCLTAIIPVFNEEEVFGDLVARLRDVLPTLGFERVEVLFVDDGSRDRTRELVSEVANQPQENGLFFRGVFLTRNFGHQAAVSVGLAHAQGSVVCVMDADLQDPPEVLADLVAALADGADVAFAVRRQRKESWVKRLAYDSFYRLLFVISSIEIPRDSGDFCCMRRNVVDAMLQLPERNRFIRGLRAWVGFRQVGVPYERQARAAGETKYSWRKLFQLAYDGLFSFSNLPVKLMQFLGFVVSIGSMAVALFYLGWFLIRPEQFPAGTGWTTSIISLWFLSGVQMLFLGLLGEYVFRTFDESRRRPTALVARIVEQSVESET